MFVCHTLDRLITDSLTAIQAKTFQPTGTKECQQFIILCSFCLWQMYLHFPLLLDCCTFHSHANFEVQSRPMIAVFHTEDLKTSIFNTDNFVVYCMLLEPYKIPYHRQ